MRKLKYPVLTIVSIPVFAFALFAMGCGSSGSPDRTMAPQNVKQDGIQGPIDPQNLRECTAEEFSKLQKWSLLLLEADNLIINQLGDNPKMWTKRSEIISTATVAVKQCDTVEFYHKLKPCKKTTKNIISTSSKGYDGFTINQRCSRVEAYLNKFNLRPNESNILNEEPSESTKAPTNPSVNPPKTPAVVPPRVEPTPVQDSTGLRECTSDEFTRLNQYKNSLDKANKAISALGGVSNWKYESQAILNATATTKSCEALALNFQAGGCRKSLKDPKLGNIVKVYTSQALKQECQAARSYYYEFTQREQDLIMPNANLMLDTKIVSSAVIQPGVSSNSLELCVATNTTNQTIQYNGEKTLVIEARAYPSYTSNAQMIVMLTREGL